MNLVLSSEKNLYNILEVPSTASASAIKSAYRKLARKYHPDLNSGNAYYERKFKEITEAYEILSNEEKKKNYDILKGYYYENSQAKRNEANKAYKEAQKEFHEQTTKQTNPLNEDISNVFSDILENFKNKAKPFKTKQNRPERGSDVHTDVTISFLEALQGTTRIVNILHTEKCPNCEGKRFINGSQCPLCKGHGEESTHKKLNVKIPPNVKNGSKIRIANEGNKGYNGGKNGDLYLNIKIEQPSGSFFRYVGNNVLCTIPITPSEAVLGASIEIPTPTGKISMKIVPNTQSGQKFRLSGQGITKDGKTGDMLVTVNIEIPKNLSEKELALYKELQNLNKTDIRKNLLNE